MLRCNILHYYFINQIKYYALFYLTKFSITFYASYTLQDNNASPVWDQSFYLYVKDPGSAALTFRAMDKDLFKDDDLLGLGAISVKELIVSHSHHGLH